MSVPEIGVDELATRLARGVPLIDVRQPGEYLEGHVPGARLVPLADVPAEAPSLPRSGEVLMICRSGARSRTAAEFLIAQGVPAVNVAGGTLAWIDSGRAVVDGPAPS